MILPEVRRGIETFVSPGVSERMIALANSRKPAASHKLRRMLMELDDFKPSLRTPLSTATAGEFLRSRLSAYKVADKWAVLSPDDGIDGTYLGLAELLAAANTYPGGTFAVLEIGALGYFHGETAKQQYGLESS